MQARKYAMIWCSNADGDLPLQDSIKAIFGREADTWDVLRPDDEDFEQRAQGYAGYVISGSPLSVVDDARTPLVRSLLHFIQQTAALPDGPPIVGLCFGSQALAAAMGGLVGRNPSRRFKLGVDSLIWSTQARPVLQAAGSTDAPTVLVQSHGECVSALPPDSMLLAKSATAPHEVFLTGDRLLGIQGHPEVDNAFLRQHFMVYHRSLFDDAQWSRVEQESRQTLSPGPVIALVRSLLEQGRLQVSQNEEIL